MADVNAPVRSIPTDDPDEQPVGMGLCLSGGGYRAMLFHAGALWRLHELGWLRKLDRISSVSGGSITAGVLALAWDDLDDFEGRVVRPLRDFALLNVDANAIAVGLLTPDTIGERLSASYREHLFGDATLQDLPDAPRFIINATNLASGVLFRFSKRELADWRVGRVPAPTTLLADAVAASSAFPPVLSPFDLDLRGAAWEDEEGNELNRPEYRGHLRLSDGGVYDNLGLETVWKKCATVLVSDAGGALDDDPDPPADWVRQFVRVAQVVDNQVRDLRKWQVRDLYARGARDGAYWGIRSDIANYHLDDALPAPHARTIELAEIPTRLAFLDPRRQEQLINWGYTIADAAMRKHVVGGGPPPGVPYP